jgi:hypothetical protein
MSQVIVSPQPPTYPIIELQDPEGPYLEKIKPIVEKEIENLSPLFSQAYIDSTSFERVEKLTEFLRRITTIFQFRQFIAEKALSSMVEQHPDKKRTSLRLKDIKRGLTFLQQSFIATLNLYKKK